MLINRSVLLLIALLSFWSISPVQAEKPNNNSANESFWSGWFKQQGAKSSPQIAKVKAKKAAQIKAPANRLFSDTERAAIQHFYRPAKSSKNSNKGKPKKAKKSLPYGLQKKLALGGQLPAGWQKKVIRGEVLDSQTLKHSQFLPGELANRLPRREEGVQIRRVGDKVVRVLEGSGTVVDVIDLADIILRQ